MLPLLFEFGLTLQYVVLTTCSFKNGILLIQLDVSTPFDFEMTLQYVVSAGECAPCPASQFITDVTRCVCGKGTTLSFYGCVTSHYYFASETALKFTVDVMG